MCNYIKWLFMVFFLVNTTNIFANECGILKLKKMRSHIKSITQNSCKNYNELSLESVLEIMSGGRVWLEPLNNKEKNLIICQNNYTEPASIRINSENNPWIIAETISKCSEWVNNRLDCNKKFICSVSKLINYDSKPYMTMHLSTSLSMNGIKQDEEENETTKARSISFAHKKSSSSSPKNKIQNHGVSYNQDVINDLTNYLKPEIDLCKNVFTYNKSLTMTITLNTDGNVTNNTIKEKIANNTLAECVLDVIKDSNLPSPEEETSIIFKF